MAAAARKTNRKRSSSTGRRRGRKRNTPASQPSARKINTAPRKANRRRTRRAATHSRRHTRKRNTGVARSSALRLKNPAGGSLGIGGIVGTGVLVALVNSLVNRTTQNQSPVMGAGIKIGVGVALAKWGKKIPFLGNYAALGGAVFMVLAVKDLFDLYAVPKLAGFPVVGQFFGAPAPLTQLPANGMGDVYDVSSWPVNGGMGDVYEIDGATV